MNKPLLWMLLATGLIACKPSGTLHVDDAPSESTDDGEGKSPPIEDAALFAPDHLIEVEIELDPGDWNDIRNQTRDFYELLGGDCLAEPFASPFTYFEAEITVDGEVIEDVGVRKKGLLGSMSWDKPSLKIKTDKYVDGQLMENGTERLTLNNNVQDPSLINQCLGYGVFRAAGLPAPRCNFATVTVNGEDLGVFTHVEAVKKDFLKRHFEDNDGDLYEGTLSDFHDGWNTTFDPKTDDTDIERQIIADITEALKASDSDVLDSVGAIVDLPDFYKFWAIETLIAHSDGYASNQNNFLIYRDPTTDLVTFIPWGADALFMGADSTPAAFTTGWLTQRLWMIPEAREAYINAMEEVLDTAWNEDDLHGEIDRMQDLIVDHSRDPLTVAAYMDEVRRYVADRRGFVESQLPGLANQGVPDEIRDPFCIVDMGTVSSDFDTLYDTIDVPDPFIYDATLIGESFPGNLQLAAVAGDDGYGGFVVATYGVDEGWTELYQVVAYMPAGVGPGTHDLEFGAAYAISYDLTVPDDEGEIIGLILGTVTFDAVGETPGDPVVGTISGDLLGGLF